MELSQDEVIEILKLVEESSFDELELNMDGLKLVVRRAGKGTLSGVVEQATITPTNFSPAATASRPAAPAATQEGKEAGTAAASASPSPATATVAPVENGVVAIVAPTVGTFYRAPKPGAPPFVQEGSVVSEDDTVCILEVMKCFISVKAKVKGTISKVCAQNEQMVEFGQQLFLVKTEDKMEPATP